MTAAWRVVASLLATTALAAGTAGCSERAQTESDNARKDAPDRKHVQQPRPAKQVRLIGDGSTSYTGAQPHQPTAERLKPGARPPQFVVFSWDGAGQDGQKLFSHFRKVGRKYDAAMTYFLSGVYLLPGAKKELYDAPKHPRGASDIGFNDAKGIKATVAQIRGAWLEGSEIGTHFNGHFCGPNGGVGTWSEREWKTEIKEARSFVRNWRTNAKLRQEKSLPFDYAKELVGGRAPCLEGQKNLIPAAKAMGFRYDSSSVGGRQVWPSRIHGVWDFPLQQVPVPGRAFETLSMDYNFLANQSGTTKGDPTRHAAWGRQMRGGLVSGFNRVYRGNRAPMYIGNHFESWNGGTYMRAVEGTIKTVCTKKGVRCVSFKQLADWLDAQDPKNLKKLRTLDVGERPKGGWAGFLDAQPTEPTRPPALAVSVKPVAE
ncbi:hypothetical protein [Streptomyces sp. H27-D2]|uniref:hypothetical protein n=1 Tax=Streptomyces sp. H27-D2 TaxID=3046304 RepID=UPI002DB61D93|nr:hypothetical protein [Streptomyces sp. H27-D2]MEC4014995.1 hypothetical protein [Streptomyces sp. H27-D2]